VVYVCKDLLIVIIIDVDFFEVKCFHGLIVGISFVSKLTIELHGMCDGLSFFVLITVSIYLWFCTGLMYCFIWLLLCKSMITWLLLD